jgi:hypothetical protein
MAYGSQKSGNQDQVKSRQYEVGSSASGSKLGQTWAILGKNESLHFLKTHFFG